MLSVGIRLEDLSLEFDLALQDYCALQESLHLGLQSQADRIIRSKVIAVNWGVTFF